MAGHGLRRAWSRRVGRIPIVSVALVPVGLSAELVAREVERLPLCGACRCPAARVRRLGGVGRPLCDNCYQGARRGAESVSEELRAAALRASASILYEELLALGLGPRSIRQYQRSIWSADAWFAAKGWSLTRATASQVVAYADTKPKTFASRSLLRVALGHYWTIARHPKPPVKAIRVPPKPTMVCRALEADDARRLAEAARHCGDRRGLAVLLGLYQALRREEIATLRWEDFDVVQQGWVRILGKGSKTRTIPLHPTVMTALAGVDRTSEWMFVGRSGHRPVCPATIWQWTRELAEIAGVDEVHTHWLRHTALATQNDATGDLRTVQAFAGHSNPQTTAGYTRASKTRMQVAVLAIDY